MSPLSKALLQGEQCNIVPDNVDDIVADLAPEEKDEGTLFPLVASGNINWHHLLGKQCANMLSKPHIIVSVDLVISSLRISA